VLTIVALGILPYVPLTVPQPVPVRAWDVVTTVRYRFLENR